MEIYEAIGVIIVLIFVLSFFVMGVLILIYSVKLLSVLPGSIQKIADAIDRMSRK